MSTEYLMNYAKQRDKHTLEEWEQIPIPDLLQSSGYSLAKL